MENFNYTEAVEELEKLVGKVEDPSTGIEEIERCIKRSDELIRLSRNYLRELQIKTDNL